MSPWTARSASCIVAAIALACGGPVDLPSQLAPASGGFSSSGAGGVSAAGTAGGGEASGGQASGGAAGSLAGGQPNGGGVAGLAGGGGGGTPNLPDDCVPPSALPDLTPPGPHAVGHSRYQGESIRLGDDRYVVSVAADVFYPASAAGEDAPPTPGGPYPVVVMLHGMHAVFRAPTHPIYCAYSAVWKGPSPHVKSLEEMRQTEPQAEVIPNNLGYRYLGENLASAGYVFVSIDGNTTNCLPYVGGLGFIPERGELMREHLRRLAARQLQGIAHLNGALDLSRVVLAGHSRGGEAAILAAAAGDVPGVTLRGVMAVAPTSWRMGERYSAEAPLEVAPPLLMLLGAADGDQTESGGMRYYDIARPSAGATGWFKAQQFVHGANHNFFNSEWNDDSTSCGTSQPDGDNGVGHGDARLSRPQQERYLVATTRVFLQATLENSDAARSALAGNAAVSGLEQLIVARSYQDPATMLALPANVSADGAVIGFYPFRQSPSAYNSSFFHETDGYVASWQSLPASIKLLLGGARRPRYVAFRAAQVADASNPTNRFAKLDVALVDSLGRRVTAGADWAGGSVPPYYPRPPEPDPYEECAVTSNQKTVLSSVRIPLACFKGDAAFDVSSLRELEILPRDERGALAFDDFQLE